MFNLYPHNQYAFNKLISSLETNSRACLVQPTGTGKSFITAELIKTYPDKMFLLLTPTNYIIDQFNDNFEKLFSNYQYRTYSSLLSKRLSRELLKSYDFIILDEFHRAGADLWGTQIQQLLQDNKTAKIIGLSATHIRYLEEDRDIIEELFEGNLIHHLTLMESFDVGILPRPKYISCVYNIEHEFNDLLKKINNSKSPNKLALQQRVIEYRANWEFSNGVDTILLKHIKNERNFLIFCKSIEHLNTMMPIVNNWFKVFGRKINLFKVYHLDNNSRKSLFDFKSETSNSENSFNLLFSIQQLNEGIHINNVDGVIFLRPTESHIIYYQQLGRCLQTKGNQPIVFDMVNNFNKSNTHISFKSSDYTPQFHNTYLPSEYDKFTFPFEVLDEVIDIRTLFEEVNFAITDWLIDYNKLKKELISNNNFEDISSHSKQWLSIQKARYLNSDSSIWHQRKSLLDELNEHLGFCWDSDSNRNNVWYKQFKLFKTHLTESNNYLELEDEYKYWFINQSYILKKASTQEAKLKSNSLDTLIPLLGFDWRETTFIKNKWEEDFQRFENALRNSASFSNIPHKLKKWFQGQRTHFNRQEIKSDNLLYKKMKFETLTPLLGADWLSDSFYSPSWLTRYGSFKKELINKGNYKNISSEHKEWLHTQRASYRRAKYMERWKTRVEKLDSLNKLLGFDWKQNKFIKKQKKYE